MQKVTINTKKDYKSFAVDSSIDIIDRLKKYNFEKIYSTIDENVIACIKEVGVEVNTYENDGIYNCRIVIYANPNLPFDNFITVYVNNGLPQLIEFSPYKGICTDKMVAHKILPKLYNAMILCETINNDRRTRAALDNYHDSYMFENDFKTLTEIQNICKDLVDKINKFKEQLTLGYN